MMKNKAYCKKCLDVIESKHRHDFVTCKCGSLSLDGGLAYRRVLWKGGDYADTYGAMNEEVAPDDITRTANVSAIERDLEQQYYQKMYQHILKEGVK